jgi:hypothetical protein
MFTAISDDKVLDAQEIAETFLQDDRRDVRMGVQWRQGKVLAVELADELPKKNRTGQTPLALPTVVYHAVAPTSDSSPAANLAWSSSREGNRWP